MIAKNAKIVAYFPSFYPKETNCSLFKTAYSTNATKTVRFAVS